MVIGGSLLVAIGGRESVKRLKSKPEEVEKKTEIVGWTDDMKAVKELTAATDMHTMALSRNTVALENQTEAIEKSLAITGQALDEIGDLHSEIRDLNKEIIRGSFRRNPPGEQT